MDFAFRSAATTIQVGDTVTWTNQGPTDHTATAVDHSFDTGILKKGARAGHTFRSAGTFAYICTIHPNMKGTIRVRGAADPQPPAPQPSAAAPHTSGAAPRPAPSRARSGPQLPATGTDTALVAAAGLALLTLGLTTRRLAT